MGRVLVRHIEGRWFGPRRRYRPLVGVPLAEVAPRLCRPLAGILRSQGRIRAGIERDRRPACFPKGLIHVAAVLFE